MARVVLLTENEILARGFLATMETAAGLEALACCRPEEWLKGAIVHDPDVILIDFVQELWEPLTEIRCNAPEAKIVLWMQDVSFGLAFHAMRLGVRGILRKSFGQALTIKCLQKVAAGELWFDQQLSAGFLETPTVELSPREGQITILVSQGLKNKEIGASLGISEATVRMYLTNVFRKLGMKDRYELALFGLKNLAGTAHMTKDQAQHPARRRLRFPVQIPQPDRSAERGGAQVVRMAPRRKVSI